MIRLIQRRLIIPRGDTGAFTIPVIKPSSENVAVFTIFDDLTHTRLFQKRLTSEGDVLNIAFTHNETVNLKPGKYLWDIKYYSNPLFVEDELVGGDEVDSYYAGYSLPVCEIRPTGDDYLISDDAPSATLAPDQLDIITNAITALNEAVEKTQTNVEHYPVIRDETWYVWDAESNDYVSTEVSANGIVGNGIASAVLNNDYTLTLNFTDGTSFTTSSIRGATGNGIDDIVLNNDFTLTIIYTDGERYTTPSIRGPVGATPQFSIGTVQDGAVAAASITGTAENPVLNLTLPNANVPTRVSQLENDAGYLTEHQDLSDYVRNTDYATNSEAGVVKVGAGLAIDGSFLTIYKASNNQIKQGTASYSPIVPSVQERSTFYGLAKAAGDTTQSQSSNAVGTYTNEAKAAIQTMLDVPSNEEMNTAIGTAIGQVNSFDIAVVQELPTQDISTHTIYLVPKTGDTNDVYDEYVYINDNWEMVGNTQIDLSNYATKDELPDVPVQDVQVNGTSVLDAQGVANIPKTTDGGGLGVSKTSAPMGITVDNNGILKISAASDTDVKNGGNTSKPVTPQRQHMATFYGLAKAAGADMKDIANTTVGIYPDAQKEAIQSMLGITQMLAPTNPNLVASQAYAIGDVFAANGHLYKATAAIAQDEAIIPDTNCVETTMAEAGGKIKDVQVNSASVVGSDGVADIPVATKYNNGGRLGVVSIGQGLTIQSSGMLFTDYAKTTDIKTGANYYMPITPVNQHQTIFYGLSKVAGVDLANEAVTLGTYPETSKTAIRSMLGATSDNVIAVQDTQPIDPDTKIWLPETPETPVQVPTVAEMNAALAGKVSDVQVNGTSVVSGGVANVPIASANVPGVARAQAQYGITIVANDALTIQPASDAELKAGATGYKPITPHRQHTSTFYGLAKAAGDSTQSASDNAVGTYTDSAKTAIKTMLGVQDGVTSVNGSTGAVTLSIPSTAADVGAIPAPSSPATGAFLVWSGSAWVAQTLSTWQGGNY